MIGCLLLCLRRFPQWAGLLLAALPQGSLLLKDTQDFSSSLVLSLCASGPDPLTALRFRAPFCWGGGFFLRRVVSLAAFVGAGAVLPFGFRLRLGELGLVQQVVDLPVQKGQFGLDVLGQKDGPFLGRALVLLRYRLVFPRLQRKQVMMTNKDPKRKFQQSKTCYFSFTAELLLPRVTQGHRGSLLRLGIHFERTHTKLSHSTETFPTVVSLITFSSRFSSTSVKIWSSWGISLALL